MYELYIDNIKYYVSYFPTEKTSKLNKMKEVEITISMYLKKDETPLDINTFKINTYFISKRSYMWIFENVNVINIEKRKLDTYYWSNEDEDRYDYYIKFTFDKVISSHDKIGFIRNFKLDQII